MIKVYSKKNSERRFLHLFCSIKHIIFCIHFSRKTKLIGDTYYLLLVRGGGYTGGAPSGGPGYYFHMESGLPPPPLASPSQRTGMAASNQN